MGVGCVTTVDVVWGSRVELWTVCGVGFRWGGRAACREAGVSANQWPKLREMGGVTKLEGCCLAEALVGRKIRN